MYTVTQGRDKRWRVWNGDDIVVSIPDTLDDAQKLTERIAALLNEHGIETPSFPCKYCGKLVQKDWRGAWIEPKSALPQYCYADMVSGSRLHSA